MQKKAFPRSESRNTASKAVGRSVSSPSTPRDLWCVRWYGFYPVSSTSLNIIIDKGTHSEASRIRNPNRQIRKYSERSIPLRLPESEVVADLVDGQEQVLVCGRPNHVCGAPEAEGPEWCVL